jgi:hypothetical protein
MDVRVESGGSGISSYRKLGKGEDERGNTWGGRGRWGLTVAM